MKIPGYTLHGDYYLANKVITNVNWKEACEMKKIITLLNGKTVVAHILSKEELETIPREERNFGSWYWTSSLFDNDEVWYVTGFGTFYHHGINNPIRSNVRLGFRKNKIKQFLDVE
jgi:hypothetical protein